MKTCPQCLTGYPDSHTTCPIHGVLLNEIRDLRPGIVIRKTYRIIRKLGQGGFGSVYLAQHILMDEPRALKFLSGELSRDQAFTARFRREVRTLRKVRNRNVVDCGDLEAAEDDSLFFPMEFVDGPDLRSLLHTAPQPFDVELALAVTRGIAEGLGAAHSKGMVHRDIKPENILMAREGDCWLPKIVDFGIVATKESRSTLTRTGGTLLTMNYAAPEQWRGTPAAELDGRTDLYALGGVLFEMLTGQTPFHAENYEGWARQHQSTPPLPPSTLRPDLANWLGLDALVLRLLAKDREDRPKDVAELVGLINKCIDTNVAKERLNKEEVAEEWLKKGMVFHGQPPVFPPPLALLYGAAERGEANAQNDLGVVYEIAETYPKKPEYWVKIISKSASGATSTEAMSHLNRLASHTRQDYKLAAFWYRRAAEQGFAVAQNNLAFLYSTGQGVPQDNTQAAVWFRRAAEQGLGRAQIRLAELYEKGLGVPKDYLQAELWLRKAAEQNIWLAKHELGILYCKGGEGLQPDFTEAYFWLYLAAMGKKNANLDKSSKALDAAAAKLTESQISAVQKRAENWSPRITKAKA